MGERRHRRRWSGVAWAVAVLVAAGCSDDDDAGSGGEQPDGAALAAPFGEAAEAAYEGAGGDRAEDYTQGVMLDGDCFALETAGVEVIAEALGLDGADAEIGQGTFLSGRPDRDEILFCPLDTGAESGAITVTVGTVSTDRDGVLAQVRQGAERDDEPLEEIEGGAPGLPDDQVIAISQDDGRILTFGWVDDGFRVALSYPSQLAEAEDGFRALRAAVDAVSATLTRG